jgi:preprotein translocase subunit SecG
MKSDMLNMLMASSEFWNYWPVIKIIALVVMAICAIFIILVVLFQPGNSSGVGALGGQTETFLGKNKSKTFEHKMKMLTIIASVIFVVLSVVFAIVAFFAAQ